MSKKLIKNGVSSTDLVNNLNAEMVGGLTKDEMTGIVAINNTNGHLIKLKGDINASTYYTIHIIGNNYERDIPTNIIIQLLNNKKVNLRGTKAINYGGGISEIKAFYYNDAVYLWINGYNTQLFTYYCTISEDSKIKYRGNGIESVVNSELPENVEGLIDIVPQYSVLNNTGKAFDMLDFNASTTTLEGLQLPPIQNIGTIILRYNGVVDLNDYVKNLYSWLKIYVHNNFLVDYRNRYPQIANLIHPINKNNTIGNGMLDMPSGVFIVYNSNPGYTSCINLQNYNTSYNDLVQGILVVEGNNSIVVATKDFGPCFWCSTNNVDGGGFTTTDMTRAQADLNGKLNTAFQILHEECQDPSCAVGFCANYGTEFWPAGNWWLPSLGEITLINSHIDQVNYALSLVGGDLLRNIHWSSTEANKDRAWYTGMTDKNSLCLYNDTLKSNNNLENAPSTHPWARPVTKLSVHTNSSYKSQGLPAMTMIDTTSAVLPDISNLPDIQTLDRIILRYEGVVSDLNTYLASAPITLDDLISQGLIDSDTTAQDLVDMGILDEAQLEHTDSNSTDIEIPREKFSDLQDAINEKITAQNNSIAKANQSGSLKSKGLNDTNASFEVNNFEIMPLVNLDDYVKTPNNWLKIYVPKNQLEAYREAYPQLYSLFNAITLTSHYDDLKLGGRNHFIGSKKLNGWSIQNPENGSFIENGYEDFTVANINAIGRPYYNAIGYTFSIKKGVPFTASWMAKSPQFEIVIFSKRTINGPSVDDGSINIRIIDNGNSDIQSSKSCARFYNEPDEWKHYYTSFISDTDCYCYFTFRVLVDTTSLFSAPKLEFGNIPTDWTPAPEDIDSEISTLNESLESTKQEFNNYISLEELKTIFPDKSEEIDLLISSKQSQEP